MRWGVLGASSRIHRQRLRPAFALAGQRIVAEASRRGDDLSAYEELLADDGVDAVYVPLPNALHVPWITRALECGKHVLCEKPLTMSGAETESVFAAAADAGRHLSEAYMWPHHPRSRRLVELVSAGDLGTLISHHAAFTFVLDRPTDHRFDERGGGALLDVGIYCLGPALFVGEVAEPGEVVARARRSETGVDVSMSGSVVLAGDATASFVVSYEAPARRQQVLTGTGGLVVIDNHVPGPERPGSFSVLRPDGSREEVGHAGANAYERMVTAFAAEAAGEVEPRWGPPAAVRLAHLIDALHAASASS